jgi:hypothetical protein
MVLNACRPRFATACLLGCLLVIAEAALGGSVTVSPIKDTTIVQNNPDNSAGGQNQMYAGTNTGASPRRGLVEFDLSSLPAGITITEVTLTMRLTTVAGGGMAGGGGSPTIGLHELTREWGEGNRTVGQGQGEAALNGDATWNAALHGTQSWATPGGDFDATASSSLTIVGTTTGVDYTWPSTPALVADVAGWYQDPTANHGWLLKNADESAAQTFRAFATREADTAASIADDSFDPRLTITWAPEPGSWLLLLVGGVLTLAAARFK